MPAYKIPISILAVIFNIKHEILLLQRKDVPNFWQSVTGSIESFAEQLKFAARREILEETSIVINNHSKTSFNQLKYLDTHNLYHLYDLNHQVEYEIFPQFRYRYPPNIISNKEHWFMLKVHNDCKIILNPIEHSNYKWIPWQMAINECFSPNNALAIKMIFNQLMSF